MGIFERAVDLLRKEGPVGLTKGVIRFLDVRLRPRIRKTIFQLRALAKDTQQISLRGVTATYHVTSWKELEVTESISEKPVLEDILAEVRPTDVVYDIGAATGTHTILFAKKTSQVVAFEPFPTNAERIKDNASLNGVSPQIIQAAVSNRIGETDLAIHRNTVGDAGHTLVKGIHDDSITVDMVSIDSLVSSGEIPAPDIVKLDVEGVELNVLEGMVETISESDLRRIYVEIHREALSSLGHTGDDVRDFFREQGYTVTKIHERDNTPFWRAER